MTVEVNARFVSDLNESYPRSQDLIKEGDDHIRLIKNVIKNTFPGFKSSLTISSDKLNKVDRSLTYDGDTLVVNSNTKLATGKQLDANSNRVVNLADPIEDTDAVSLKFVKNSVGGVAWPIGSVFLTTDDRNPSDLLGIGTWERVSQGRMIVGVGTTTDSNGLQRTFQNGATGGEYFHTLTGSEVPTVAEARTTNLFSEVDLDPPRSVSSGSGIVDVGCRVSASITKPTKIRIRGNAFGEAVGDTNIGVSLRVYRDSILYSDKGYGTSVANSFTGMVDGSAGVLLSTPGDYRFECWVFNTHPAGTIRVKNVSVEVMEIL